MVESSAMPIRLLEAEANAKGDLFTRLTEDLLLVLGYESLRTNVHHAGREVDLIARHRTENRLAIVECKATKDLIGGDSLNKFYGVLDLERRRMGDTPVEGYFVSLSGFRGTAIEQEVDAALQRFVLMDGRQVAEQLVMGGVLVAEREAAALASAIQGRDPAADLLDRSELLGCRLGWIWCVYFGAGDSPSHFALIHASGSVLPLELALEVVAQDERVGGRLGDLQLLSAPPSNAAEATTTAARTAYAEYLQQEFGYITLEGLPADQELGSRRIVLEDLFVPLSLQRYEDEQASIQPADEESRPAPFGLTSEVEDDVEENVVFGSDLRLPVELVLEMRRHVAILAVPGGGKSTLLKHLATTNGASPQSPGKAQRLSVVIRCRQLRHTSAPITEVLKDVPQQAEFPHLATTFGALVDEALLAGNLTVLVDGLDEIADDQGRVAFASQLRTFASLYPDVQIIVTSRPGGYRAVAGVLAPVCEAYRIADFDERDIVSLTKRWHRAVIGPSSSVQGDAVALAARIVATDRVRRLATNPLLLTTLLLVKRWVGDLPRKRSVLYERAIEVLLMTWNIEGHEPIEQDEALPQLAYVAYEMTASGEQTISEPRLKALLHQAREQMPDILGYTKVGIGDFIRRIEDRSSVLSMSSRSEESGRVVAQYEFKHLTFQEYLTALAVTDSFCTPRLEGATLVETLAPRLGRSGWTEVVPLAAVLAGRDAGTFVRYLIDEARARPVERDHERITGPAAILAQCLADEVKITPALAHEACRVVGHRASVPYDQIDLVLASRFGTVLREIVIDALRAGGDELDDYSNALGSVAAWDFGIQGTPDVTAGTWADEVAHAIDIGDWVEQACGCLAVMEACWQLQRDVDPSPIDIDVTYEWLEARVQRIAPLVPALPEGRSYAAAWALAWLGMESFIAEPDRLNTLNDCFSVWRDDERSTPNRRMAAWAFSSVPLVPRDLPALVVNREQHLAFVAEEANLHADRGHSVIRRHAAFVAAYYLRGPWSDSELAELCRAEDDPTLQRVIDAVSV